MIFSLNEIEVMGKRAARGAGLAWGVAEEAGKAARWLSAHGQPGAKALAALLSEINGQQYDERAPVSTAGVWHAPAGRLCPLIAGAALCDLAAQITAVQITTGHEIGLGATAQPLLLAPYAAAAVKLTGTVVELSWAGVVMIFAPQGVAIKGAATALCAESTDNVLFRRGENVAVVTLATTGQNVDAQTWSRLDTFAQRTFAPATAASRLSGAGAGLLDND